MSDDKFASSNDSVDPFAKESAPSLSFKRVKEGHTYSTKILSLPVVRQQRDFESGEMLTWPDGNKREVVVMKVEVDGEEFSVWAKKPSSLFSALQNAQKEAGTRFAVGGTLDITWESSEPNAKNAKLNDVKIYKAKYAAPDALA